MNSPIESALSLNIGSDPTSWILDNSKEDVTYDLVKRKLHAAQPFALPVAEPLEGELALSPRAGNVSLISFPRGHNWNPSDVPTSPFLYIATAVGPAADQENCYVLAHDADVEELQRRILKAMADPDVVTVEVTAGGGSGVLVLNGATLPFVVLCKVRPRSQQAAS